MLLTGNMKNGKEPEQTADFSGKRRAGVALPSPRGRGSLMGVRTRGKGERQLKRDFITVRSDSRATKVLQD